MLWIFYRDRRHASYEIRLSQDGTEYELLVRSPDGSERLERFDDSDALSQRALEVQWKLVSEGWRGAGPPQRHH